MKDKSSEAPKLDLSSDQWLDESFKRVIRSDGNSAMIHNLAASVCFIWLVHTFGKVSGWGYLEQMAAAYLTLTNFIRGLVFTARYIWRRFR